MTLFDCHIIVDWSGGNDTGPKPRADAIWACVAGEEPVYLRNRTLAEDWLAARFEKECAAGRRVMAGFDFPFGYPEGFGSALTDSADPMAVWDWYEARVEDAPDANNRFDLAGDINRGFAGVGPFWGNGLKRDIEGLPRKGLDRTEMPFAEKRAVEILAKGAFPVWQLSGVGAVGSQIIMGLPVLARLRRRFGAAVWPFEPLESPVALVEIWPSLLADQVRTELSEGGIKDAVQVAVTARAFAALDQAGQLDQVLSHGAGSEGWIAGVGEEGLLRAAARGLKDDCFALPAGVFWTPVDDALSRLEGAIKPALGAEMASHGDASGRVMARDVQAHRSHPPGANSAVDGYGFRHASLPEGPQLIPICPGRAAAGAPFEGVVPDRTAVRILTGALLPEGVDTVILEEDCVVENDQLSVPGLPKSGSNTRQAGEDVAQGETALSKGRVLRPADQALMAALGVDKVEVFERLRVGVLSTGDELVNPSEDAADYQTFDANRPMLLSMAERWGYASVDLGHVRDNRDALRSRLNEAQELCDVVLTSGGASGGDEDHVSALLKEEGRLNVWRIALKPGRPLVLAEWGQMPIFGLPGNPVAAMVCTLIFARPALRKMSGANFASPQGFDVPAGFEKKKKPGRREYLRARIADDGRIEIFASEGSGRISGMSWADGLVELPDGACHVRPGDLVRYLPYASFGL